MRRFVLGVDPGLTGALSLLSDGRFVECWDMPTMGRGKGTKQQVNCAELARIVRELPADCIAFVENVHSMPKQGVASSFAFGASFGAMRGVLAGAGVAAHYVEPGVWKRGAGLLGADKDIARTKAIELFPVAPLSRKKDIGRADALLIALHGWRALNQTTA